MALIYRRSSRKMLARLRRVRCKPGASIIVSSDQRNLVFSICPEVADPQSAIGRLENYPCRSPGPPRAGPGAGPGHQGLGQGGARAQGEGGVREGKARAGPRAQGDGQGQFSSVQVSSGQVRSGQSSQRFLTWNVFRGLFPRQGLALAVPPWYGPVPWDPWPGEGHALRWIDLPRCRPALPALALLGRALLGQAARSRAASGRTGPAVSRSGSESNGADGPGSVH